MRSPSSWLLASVAALPLAVPAVVHAEPYRFHYDHVLGTSLDVTATAPDEASALMAVSAVRREIERLDPLLSAWRTDSELSRLNRASSAGVSPELFSVLERCEGWREATGGAFDCRAGGVLALWRQAEAGGAVDAAALQAAAKASRQALRLDAAERIVHRPDGVCLTVDGVAKGYVIDSALAAARKASPGLKGLMIDIGGDLRCWGQAPEVGGWKIGVAGGHDADNAPAALALRLDEGAVAVSGRGARDLKVGGAVLSHTLDPASGRPVARVQHAVVKAPLAADADALATAFMVMKPEQAIALADRTDGVEALVTDADGVVHPSRGWTDLVDRLGKPRLIRAAAEKGLGLDLAYQVPKIDAQPYHAPYVVMWLTDENRQMVRTLLVLGPKPKWAPENFVWWRRYGRQTPQVLDTMARPTRLPGRYTVHWDGHDDAGKPAPAGRYILHIEASREKGGHTYQTIDIDLSGAGGAKALPAKDEMGAVDLKFGPSA